MSADQLLCQQSRLQDLLQEGGLALHGAWQVHVGKPHSALTAGPGCRAVQVLLQGQIEMCLLVVSATCTSKG